MSMDDALQSQDFDEPAKVEAARPDLAAIQARAEAWAGAEPVEDFEAARDRAALLDEVARLESALKGWIGDAERLQREVAQLTRERDAAYRKGLQEGFDVAESEAWISTWDGWHVTDPRIDWEAAQKALEKAKAEVKP